MYAKNNDVLMYIIMNKVAYEYSDIPKPSLNGGLYTGAPFTENAPWANVPVVPDASYMIHYNLRSANPPPGAIYQYPGSTRPGNNTLIAHGVSSANNVYNLTMIRENVAHQSQCKCYKCGYTKYSYL